MNNLSANHPLTINSTECVSRLPPFKGLKPLGINHGTLEYCVSFKGLKPLGIIPAINKLVKISNGDCDQHLTFL